jgi:alpha-L-rhamnosidase
MNSFNHYSLGAVVDWVYARVGGIDAAPGAQGYSEVVVAPRPGAGVTRATASMETPRGRVAVAWQLDGDVLTLDVETPPGVSAQVSPPEGFAIDGEGSGEVLALDSGRHHLTATR